MTSPHVPSTHLLGMRLERLLADLTEKGWRPADTPAKAKLAPVSRPVYAFLGGRDDRLRLELTLYGDPAAPRHRLEIAAAHPDTSHQTSLCAWRVTADDPADAVIRALASAAITPVTRGVTIDRQLPKDGWSVLNVYEPGARLVETRYIDHRGHTVSLFPADSETGEPAVWLIVRPGFDGRPAAIRATALTPPRLIATGAIVPRPRTATPAE